METIHFQAHAPDGSILADMSMKIYADMNIGDHLEDDVLVPEGGSITISIIEGENE